jgi:rhodanese-related sulfurtransferase
MSSMSATEMAAYLQQASPLLLDVREPWEFEICHIEGSINLPMGQISQRVEDLPESGEIVVICHHGVRSQQVIRFLQGQMTASLINLDGGVDAWAREVERDMPLY